MREEYQSRHKGEIIDEAVDAVPYLIEYTNRRDNPHQVNAAQVGTTNPNYIDNWDLRNAINQYGQSSYVATESLSRVFFDRFVHATAGGTSMVTANNSDGLNVAISNAVTSDNVFIRQFFEDSLPSGTYTLSVEIRGPAGASVAVSIEDNVFNHVCSGEFEIITHTITAAISYVEIFKRPDTNGVYSIRGCYLERGSVSTYKNALQSKRGTELAKCQRYINVLQGNTRVRVSRATSSNIDAHFPTVVSMRAHPQIVSLGGNFRLRMLGNADAGDFEFRAVTLGQGVQISVVGQPHTFTDGSILVNGGPILLDASL